MSTQTALPQLCKHDATSSCSHWDLHKDTIEDLYLHQNLTLPEVRRILRENFEFTATERQYSTRLKIWDMRKSMKSQTKDELCARVTDDFISGKDLPLWILPNLGKLLRYWKQRMSEGSTPDVSEKQTLQALQHFINQENMLDSAQHSQQGEKLSQSSKTTASNNGGQDSSFRLRSQMTASYSSSSTQSQTYSSSAFRPGSTAVTRGTNLYLQPTIYAEATDSPTAFEECLRWTRMFYNAKLEQHKSLHDTQQEASLDMLGDHNKVYEGFWHDLESAIYFLKVGDTDLAHPLLNSIYHLVPTICKLQPLAFWRHVLTTLAPSNTDGWPGIRELLLKTFTQVTAQNGQQNPLWHIFHRLWTAYHVSGEWFKPLLHLLIANATQHLNNNDPELFELKCSLVRMNRRSHDLSTAESGCKQLILDAQANFGKDHARTRSAMSELVYIQNSRAREQDDPTRYRAALVIAEEIMKRAKMDLQKNYPDGQSIYAMEDVAEALQNIGGSQNIRNSALWLRRAHDAAQVLWGDSAPATLHIEKKLNALA